jgi:hypothetical protein
MGAWRLNDRTLNGQGEIQSFLEPNGNGSTTYQNIWDSAKAVLRDKFTTMSAYI